MPRTPKQVIDAALKEPWLWEYTCFGLIVVSAAVAVGSTVAGLVWGEWKFALASLGASGALATGLWRAKTFYDQRVDTRLLEVSLSLATTVAQADKVLSRLREGRGTKL